MQSSPEYKSRNAWDVYADKKPEMRAFAARYMDFISQCKTEREVVAHIETRLRQAGYSQDFGSDLVYRNLRDKAIFVARRGGEPLSCGLSLIASHVDSPRLDFKQHPFIEQAGIAQAKTHYYGGIRKYQWLARPLALHGVVVLEDGGKIQVAVGDKPGDPVFCIADLLPHLAQKQAKEKLAEAFDGEKLNIVLGHEPEPETGEKDGGDRVKKALLNLLAQKYQIGEEDLITAELEAVPAGPAAFVGLDSSLVGGYGQDDRICVFCSLEALLSLPAQQANLALIFWDREETGSDGATGASSRFFEYCVRDLARAWAPDAHPSAIMLASRALSADVTAALDPDYQDVHEKLNAALAGHGPCFSKFTGSRGKYGASEADAEFFARVRGALNRAGVPWQAAELGKVDLGGGGTVALFLAAYGIQVIDCGPPLLSMHSPFELASVADLYATWQAYRIFFESLHS